MAYGELAAIGRGYGVKILVENVVCNVEDPMKRWQELTELLNGQFEKIRRSLG